MVFRIKRSSVPCNRSDGFGILSMPRLSTIMPRLSTNSKRQSCLIQDEPGGGAGFSYKMSLEELARMLVFDHQRADIRTIEPGADSGVFGRQWRARIQGAESRGGIRLGGSDSTAATI